MRPSWHDNFMIRFLVCPKRELGLQYWAKGTICNYGCSFQLAAHLGPHLWLHHRICPRIDDNDWPVHVISPVVEKETLESGSVPVRRANNSGLSCNIRDCVEEDDHFRHYC